MNLKYVGHNGTAQRVDTYDNSLRFIIRVDKEAEKNTYPIRVEAVVLKDWKDGDRQTSQLLVGDDRHGLYGTIAIEYFKTKREADIWITAFAGAYEVLEDKYLANRIAHAAVNRFF